MVSFLAVIFSIALYHIYYKYIITQKYGDRGAKTLKCHLLHEDIRNDSYSDEEVYQEGPVGDGKEASRHQSDSRNEVCTIDMKSIK
jgi:hypothetical protein